jgi:hypothetical protein
MTDQAPSNPYQAAVWLRQRHPWLDELVTRVCGPDAETGRGSEWVEAITAGFNDIDDTNDRWADYERRNPAPRDDDAFYRWQDNGPQYATDAAKAMAPMSSGERRVLRLITTLNHSGQRCKQGWLVDDVDFDDRGAAIVEDWISVVRAQLTALQH